ncbi:ABC-F family ATP-binding cassette domain-containing protein [Clostridium sp. YIM B02506]|uniref:ABC-F family ATP-binding cassette domain-containing protein n=1 Tax=Clostridium sp. YIM B02506 TaxID=2910680 RepID=UPI001EEDA01F|nr:ABC-F family ATP-binding cassette domain-containing protein [Clostridium sp. YIM B02506]
MIILGCKNLEKSYGTKVVLNKISFSINEGDKIGIIGGNGEGKSTLFKILTGQLSADSGDVFLDKNKTLGYLSQHLELSEENTIYDETLTVFQELLNIEERLLTLEERLKEPYDESNSSYHDKLINDYTTLQDIYSHRGGYTYKGEISRILKGLGFTENDFNKYISTLSGGQKTRIALVKLLLRNPDILLLDEPTNHLDLDAIEWLEEYLSTYKGTILVISHDRFFLDKVTASTFEVIQGTIYCYNASYTKFLELRKKDQEARAKAYNLQQAEIKRQKEIIDRFRSFNREKSIRAAESREKALDKIELLDAPEKEKEASKISFETKVKSGNDVIHIENLKKAYGDKVLFNNLSMDLRRGDKVALIGENGRGKTTLFKIILEKIKADTGVKVIGRNVEIGYYDQEQSDLNLDNTILDEVWSEFPELTTSEVRGALAAFLFKGEDAFKKIHLLSGGEKCRINLLKLMLAKDNFLLLDEPTNHLDIVSREALEDAILTYDGTLMVISHDRYFLNKVITKIYELKEDGIKEYLGNYTYYSEKKSNPNRFESILEDSQGKTKTQIREERKKKKEIEKESKAIKVRLQTIEKEISQAEELLLALQEKQCLPEVFSNGDEIVKINKEISETQDKISSLYEEWETLVED